jgi:hypothetical protein
MIIENTGILFPNTLIRVNILYKYENTVIFKNEMINMKFTWKSPALLSLVPIWEVSP